MMYNRSHRRKAVLVSLSFLILLSVLSGKLISIQLFPSNKITKLVKRQHWTMRVIEPERGIIFDRAMRKLAMNKRLDSVYAESIKIKDSARAASLLSPILDMDESVLQESLSSGRPFVWLKRKISNDVSASVQELKIEAIGFVKENKRFYPHGELASHIIGFAGMDNVGLEGAELFYDEYLRGRPGWSLVNRDAKRRPVLSYEKDSLKVIDGYNLVLTIDQIIQYIAERAAEKAFEDLKAASVTIIVMNPKNGDILAMVNRPTFDPNLYNNFVQDMRRNRAIVDTYEPGSTFKVITASSVLEEGLVQLQERFFCENGAYRVTKGHVLHDHVPHGWLTFEEIIDESSNIGVYKVAERIKRDRFYHYIKGFGFGGRTGIGLPGESKGTVYPISKWSKLSMMALPMGHEIAVTSLQMVCAISSIANKGVLMKPGIVMSIIDKDGNIIKSEEQKELFSRVVSERTAKLVTDILVKAVEDGTGVNARLNGYRIAGKTGTAQKIEASGKYSHDKFVASFIGFAPADDPRVSIAVVIDEPKGSYYTGGAVAAPVFRNVVSEILKYMEIPPLNNERLIEAKRWN